MNCHPDVRVTSAREPSAQWKRLDRPLGMLEEVPYRAGCLGSCMRYAVPISQLPCPRLMAHVSLHYHLPWIVYSRRVWGKRKGGGWVVKRVAKQDGRAHYQD